ncbi:MAG TPA: hypothetical protein VF544_22570 [Pyrinomonadaceae bacterium]|jgi:hypothetical protein
MMKKNVFVSTTLLLLLSGVCASNGVSLQAKREGERSTWVWSHRDDGVLTEARVEGKVVFTDDYTDVSSVSEDGLFQATDERDGVARKLRVVQGPAGSVQRTYYLNGRKHEFDAEAKAWFSKFLLLAAREGGLNARARVQRLLRQRGARGVLDEISLIKTDYARRIYFTTLIEEGNLDNATLNDALRQAARQLSSDYERATFLIETGEHYLSSDDLIAVFFEATGKVTSDYERHRVLSSVLRKQPREQVLGPMLEAASSISSDYEKASFLIEAAPLYISDTALRSAFMRVVNAISSDYERGRVLSFVAKRMQTGSALD